jgi:hypothetical protein
VEIAARVFLLIKFEQGSGFGHLLDQPVIFRIRAVTPIDVFGASELGGFVNPSLEWSQHNKVLSWGICPGRITVKTEVRKGGLRKGPPL